MINFVITAGGTIENIDGVRKIVNTSTGKLGSILCQELLYYMHQQREQEDFRIHYIVSKTAILPNISKEDHKYVTFYEITDTQSVVDTIDVIRNKNQIHYFIHSMAVSDFTTSYICEISQLAKEINGGIGRECQGEERVKLIEMILMHPKHTVSKEEKISSTSDIILSLKRTPKIISQIKKLDQQVYLVGFKLLNHVNEETLVHAANTLAKNNHCDLVLANDLKDIDQDHHKGLLIQDGVIIGRFHTKEEIAKGIIKEMFQRRWRE